MLACFYRVGTEEVCGLTGLAYAGHCCRGEDDRPFVGVMSVCPGMIQAVQEEMEGRGRAKEQLSLTITHELLHIMAFSPTLMNRFRFRDGTRRTPVDEYTNQPMSLMLDTGLIQTEAVRDAARRHFGCDDLAGALLDRLEDTNQFSHWDRAPLINEIMEPLSHPDIPAVSTVGFDMQVN